MTPPTQPSPDAGAEGVLGLTEDQVPVLPPGVARLFTLHEACCGRKWTCGRGVIVGYERALGEGDKGGPR